jgi:transposase
MPNRPFGRDQAWLLPPSLADLVPADHPARFVAEFVDGLDGTWWQAFGEDLEGEALGAPAYDPRALLSIWVYGFMTGVRSSRKLELACREQLPYLWLTGMQTPDHNTLWRFYQEHRPQMRELFRQTVRTAVKTGLLLLAVQAVDGTKVGGNAARERTHDAAGLKRLFEKTEAAIADLESQNAADQPVPARLPQELAQAEKLRERVREAIAEVSREGGPKRVNLTDADASLMKNRQGFVAGYNAQAVVAPIEDAEGGVKGQIITAADVVAAATDYGQLLPLRDQAVETTGEQAAVLVADGGYHSGPNLAALAERGQTIVMPESQDRRRQSPYHKDAFERDPESDSYLCPKGQCLPFLKEVKRRGRAGIRVYGGIASICRGCPAFGVCTTDRRHGRNLEIGPEEEVLRAHRRWMDTEGARAIYRRRKTLIEPVFGIMKEQQGARRFLLRGLANVLGEWLLLTSAFNLRSLWKVWAQAHNLP